MLTDTTHLLFKLGLEGELFVVHWLERLFRPASAYPKAGECDLPLMVGR